jgi:hypothetical protein
MKNILFILFFTLSNHLFVLAQVLGCTDPIANNYDPSASINDGSCQYNAVNITPTNSWILPTLYNETSGLILWQDTFRTHNDNSDLNLYSIDTSNISSTSAYPISDCFNIDWEDIDQDSNFIYMADIGNNSNGNRTNLQILRIEKNSLLNNTLSVDTILFSYSLQTDFTGSGANNTDFDCEAIIVDHDSIYLFTKEWVSEKTSIYTIPKIPGNHVAQFKSTLDVQGLITGATYLKEKSLIVLSGYSSLLQPFLYLLYDFQGNNFISGNKRKVGVALPFHQVEGITTIDGLTYYITNERFVQSILVVEAKLHELDLANVLNHYINPSHASIHEEKNIFKVYPNPATNEIYIHSENKTDKSSYSIYNIHGNVIQSGSIDSNQKINIEQLTSGYYFIQISDINISFIKL